MVSLSQHTFSFCQVYRTSVCICFEYILEISWRGAQVGDVLKIILAADTIDIVSL